MVTRQVSARSAAVVAKAGKEFDYDLVIIGCGVGGHGAALHAVEQVSLTPISLPRSDSIAMHRHATQDHCCSTTSDRLPHAAPLNPRTSWLQQGMKVAVIEGHDVGGTCVNRGCVPSKALLAASGRVRDFRNEQHLNAMGIQVGSVSFDRAGVADHAKNLASTIQLNLQRSLEGLGVVSGAVDGTAGREVVHLLVTLQASTAQQQGLPAAGQARRSGGAFVLQAWECSSSIELAGAAGLLPCCRPQAAGCMCATSCSCTSCSAAGRHTSRHFHQSMSMSAAVGVIRVAAVDMAPASTESNGSFGTLASYTKTARQRCTHVAGLQAAPLCAWQAGPGCSCSCSAWQRGSS